VAISRLCRHTELIPARQLQSIYGRKLAEQVLLGSGHLCEQRVPDFDAVVEPARNQVPAWHRAAQPRQERRGAQRPTQKIDRRPTNHAFSPVLVRVAEGRDALAMAAQCVLLLAGRGVPQLPTAASPAARSSQWNCQLYPYYR
jgi:hypothetical protein